MAQSLASLHVHLIFSTKNREALLSENIRVDLHAYMATVLKNLGCPALLINSREDHVHLLFDLGRTVSISTAVEEVKKTSSKWIKTKGTSFSRFAWQAGYGAFAVSESNVEAVRAYIANQAEHHRKRSFQEEYRSFLCAPFRPPFQGSTIFSFGVTGRCPGLPWIAPLGLRRFTTPVVQFTNAAWNRTAKQPSASKPNRPITVTAGGGLEAKRCRMADYLVVMMTEEDSVDRCRQR